MAIEKTILKYQDVFAKNLDIKIKPADIIDKINAFDWLDLQNANNEIDYEKICFSIFNQFNFTYKKKHELIIKKSFVYNFTKAIEQIKESIIAVSKSYNIPDLKDGFRNQLIEKFYYIEYWANKKNIPVNFNEKNLEKRSLFNLDTIILSILSDKLKILNEYESSKPKK